MTWSLNEIESLAKNATRGAGRDWGLAEEAGKATRWLCAAGWPGADLLAELLILRGDVDERLLKLRDALLQGDEPLLDLGAALIGGDHPLLRGREPRLRFAQ